MIGATWQTGGTRRGLAERTARRGPGRGPASKPLCRPDQSRTSGLAEGEHGGGPRPAGSLRPGPGQADLRGFEWYYLWRICHGEKLSLQGHGGPGQVGRLFPGRQDPGHGQRPGRDDLRPGDGPDEPPSGAIRTGSFAWPSLPTATWLATGSEDHTVRIWDVATGSKLAVLKGHAQPVGSLAFAPDGKSLATAGGALLATVGNPILRFVGPAPQGEVKLWDPVPDQKDSWKPAVDDADAGLRPGLHARWPDPGHGRRLRDGFPLGREDGPEAGRPGRASRPGLRPGHLAGWQASWPRAATTRPPGSGTSPAGSSGPSSRGQPGRSSRCPGPRRQDGRLGGPRPDGLALGHRTPWRRPAAFAATPTGSGAWPSPPTARPWPPPARTARPGSGIPTSRRTTTSLDGRWPIRGHGAYALAFSPDGRALATTNADVKIWDRQSGGAARHLASLPEIADMLVAYSPDGTDHRRGRARRPRVPRRRGVARGSSRALQGIQARSGPSSSRPTGKTLATSCDDGLVRLWDPSSGRQTGQPRRRDRIDGPVHRLRARRPDPRGGLSSQGPGLEARFTLGHGLGPHQGHACAGTRGWSSGLPSRPTARCSPRGAGTGASGSGMPPPASRRA